MSAHNLRDQELWAVFVEATNGKQRTQWMLFPPRMERYGAAGREGSARLIKRVLARPGDKSKWTTKEKPAQGLLANTLKSELAQYESAGWVLRQPIVIVLDHDDYLLVWDKEKGDVKTPYKALRHVEAVAKKRGYRLVG